MPRTVTDDLYADARTQLESLTQVLLDRKYRTRRDRLNKLFLLLMTQDQARVALMLTVLLDGGLEEPV